MPVYVYMYTQHCPLPLTLMPVPGCRVSSSEASSRTLHRRSLQLDRVREVVSGGSNTEQLQHEIAHLTKESREAILDEASLPIQIPVDHGLAMKSDLQLPWNKMRAIRKYIHVCNISNIRTLKIFQIHQMVEEIQNIPC